MQTIEIDKEVFENMIKSMRFMHTMVSRMWKLLHPPVGSSKWLTPYATANALGITPRMLQTLKSNGKIGYVLVPGGNCLYPEEAIDEFLTNNRVEAENCL